MLGLKVPEEKEEADAAEGEAGTDVGTAVGSGPLVLHVMALRVCTEAWDTCKMTGRYSGGKAMVCVGVW
jgi:hypothetical protein